MDIFDQTFAVTRTLQAMALLIAAFGVSLTLLVQARERSGELALMRALGATRRQMPAWASWVSAWAWAAVSAWLPC